MATSTDNELKRLVEIATDSSVYDSGEIDWSHEAGIESPNRRFFFDSLLKHSAPWKNLKIFEIGAGTGWLMHQMKMRGAHLVEGIEPSRRSITLGKMRYHEGHLYAESFESFKPYRQYHLILAVMVFNHLKDLKAAFRKCHGMIAGSGELHLIVPSFEYTKMERNNYRLNIVPISPEEYIADIERKQGRMVEIVRKDCVYEKVASAAGFGLVDRVGLKPTPNLVQCSPRYTEFRDIAIAQFLKFKKS